MGYSNRKFMDIANTYEAEYIEFSQQEYNNELVVYRINTIQFFSLENKTRHKNSLYDIDKPMNLSIKKKQKPAF